MRCTVTVNLPDGDAGELTTRPFCGTPLRARGRGSRAPRIVRQGISFTAVFLVAAVCTCLGVVLGLLLPRYLPSLAARLTPATTGTKGNQEVPAQADAGKKERERDGGKAVAEPANSAQGTAQPAPTPNPPDGGPLGDTELRHYFDEKAESEVRAEEYLQTKMVGRVGEFSGELLSVDKDGKLRLSLDAYRGSKSAGRVGLHAGFLHVQRSPAWLATSLNSGDRINVRAKVSGRGVNAIQSDFVDIVSVNGSPPERPAK